MTTAIVRCALIALLLAPSLAAEGVSGSVKTGFSHTSFSSADPSRDLLSSSLRLSWDDSPGNLRIEAAWVLTPSMGDPPLGGADLESGDVFRLWDPGREIVGPSDEGVSLSVVNDVDRLSAGIRTSLATMTAGRQAIYWGVSRSVSPTDFLAPFQYGSLDTEYRTGIDAIRVRFPAGMMSEVEAGYAFGEDADIGRSAMWVRGRFYVLSSDATVLAARYRDNLMAGGSLNITAAGGTAWLETALVSPGRFTGQGAGETYWNLSTGYDRSWLNATLYGFLEYHFSSPGTDDASGYDEVLSGEAVALGGVYLLGRHYVCPGLRWNPAPLWTLSASSLVNVTDPSAYVSVSGEYSAGQNTVIDLGLNMPLGSSSTLGTDIGSEFGNWPELIHARMGYYF